MLTQGEALGLFSYDPDTGIVRRLISVGNTKAGAVAGNPDNKGYLKVCVSARYYKLHRVIWLMVHGEWPNQIDHINGVRDDNKLINLRSASNKENSKNRAMCARNKSGVMGVCWNNELNKWQACIRIKNKNKHLGVFSNKSHATWIRKVAEIAAGFHQNHGRKA